MFGLHVVLGMLQKYKWQWLAVIIVSAVSSLTVSVLFDTSKTLRGIDSKIAIANADALNTPIVITAITLIVAVSPIIRLCIESQKHDLRTLTLLGGFGIKMRLVLLLEVLCVATIGAAVGVFTSLGIGSIIGRFLIKTLTRVDTVLYATAYRSQVYSVGIVVILLSLSSVRSIWRASSRSLSGLPSPRKGVLSKLFATVIMCSLIFLIGVAPLEWIPNSRAKQDNALSGLIILSLAGSLLVVTLVSVWGSYIYRFVVLVLDKVMSVFHLYSVNVGCKEAFYTVKRYPAIVTAICVPITLIGALLGIFLTLQSGMNESADINYGSVIVTLSPAIIVSVFAAAGHMIMTSIWRQKAVRAQVTLGGNAVKIYLQQFADVLAIIITSLFVSIVVLYLSLFILKESLFRQSQTVATIHLPWEVIGYAALCATMVIAIPVFINTALARIQVRRNCPIVSRQ